MRLAVISDVHGNLPALEAVVADIKKRQKMIISITAPVVRFQVVIEAREKCYPSASNADEIQCAKWVQERTHALQHDTTVKSGTDLPTPRLSPTQS